MEKNTYSDETPVFQMPRSIITTSIPKEISGRMEQI
jgi:hypothetical protein